uniref:Uncharacterized protein n=1 Tax=Hyaloperonospora arabidopsidis (strain Emoy2) TaxID=559515 RepID=M4BWI4_HYAAE
MQMQVAQLELMYDVLLGAHQDTAIPSRRALSSLRQQYTVVAEELKVLRLEIAVAKQKLVRFGGFASSLTVYLADFDTAPVIAAAAPTLNTSSVLGPVVTETRARLTLEECQEMIKKCYYEICARRFHGKSLSSGMHILGWEDQMYLDGTTVQFAVTKRITGMSAATLMNKTWDILTTAQHMRTIQYSTVGLKVLHKINEDTLVLQRCVHHPQLNIVTWNNMVMFRLRCPRGYAVAYQAIDHPAYAEVHTESFNGLDFLWNQDSRPKFSCVNTFQWVLFEEDENFNFDMDSEGFDFELLGSNGRTGFSSDFKTEVPRRRERNVAPEEFKESPQRTFGVKISYGGRVDNQDASYARFYMFEVLTYMIRWENAVGFTRLTF